MRWQTNIGMNEEPEENIDSGWIQTYGDMMSLLVAFFVLIVGFSNIELIKFRKAMGSFQGIVGVVNEGANDIVRMDKPYLSGATVLNDNNLVNTLRVIEEMPGDLTGEGDVSVEITPDGVRFKISDRMLYNSGDAKLKKSALPILAKIAEVSKLYPCGIRIEGHTDSMPIHTAKFPSNWELSTARALSVLRLFVDEYNINPKKIIAVGMGEFHPRASNDTPRERALNRRVEVYLDWGMVK